MLALWILIIVLTVLLGAIPIILFLGHMHEIDDFIQSTYHELTPEKRTLFKDITLAFRTALIIGVGLYIATATLLCVLSFMEVFY